MSVSNSEIARGIFEELKGFRNKEFVKSFEVVNVKAVRQALWRRLRAEGLDYKIMEQDGHLWVRSRPRTRQQRLEAMIRKLAMYVDDENLYEEALALVDYI